MSKIIVSDTSCLILLRKIEELEVLHALFGTITTTPEVASEFGYKLPDWFSVIAPHNKVYQAEVEQSVDLGEASAIALAMEFEHSLLIIDDLKGKKFAQKLGLHVIGTLGVLVEAKKAGFIPHLKPILEKVRQTNFHLSERLEKMILALAEEGY